LINNIFIQKAAIILLVMQLDCELLYHNIKCPCELMYHLRIQNNTIDSIKAVFDFTQSTYPADYFKDTATILPQSMVNDTVNYSLLGIDKTCELGLSFGKLNTRIKLMLIHHNDSVQYVLYPFDTVHGTDYPCNCTSKYGDTIVAK